MPTLFDGTVIPSHLEVSSGGERISQIERDFNVNVSLKIGYVIGIHYPGDADYVGSTVVYDVIAPVNHGDRVVSWQTFYNVQWAGGGFSTANDFTRARLRVAKLTPGNPVTDDVVSEASVVTLLCLNGKSQSAFILGGAEHPFAAADDRNLGYYYNQTFNGIVYNINKDGELTFTFTGAVLDPVTNSYIAAPEATTGTYFKLDKTGAIVLDDVAGESIVLDKANQTISTKARNTDTQVQGNATCSTGGKTVFQASGNAVFNSSAKTYIGPEGSTEPLVLGNKLTQALKELMDILTGPVIAQWGIVPCFPHPVFVSRIKIWQAKYALKNVSPFLSKSRYTA